MILKKKEHIQMINLSKPSISTLEIKNVQRVLNTEYLGMGPETNQFQDHLSTFLTDRLFVPLVVQQLYILLCSQLRQIALTRTRY